MEIMKSTTQNLWINQNRRILLAQVVFVCILASVVFQVLDEKKVDYVSPLVGTFLGLMFWLFEVIILSKWEKVLLKYPLMFAILLKAIIYLFAVYLIINTIGFAMGLLQGKTLVDFFESLVDREQLILYAYGLLLYATLSLYMQINHLLGDGILPKFLLGYYRKPVKEHRIFMFLDLKSSTSIAEQLGADKYYAFLNDFFHEVSVPVRATSAEIYQYVGDEIVFTWKTQRGLANNNCLSLFFKIKQRVKKHALYYEKKYGVIPEFKAGIHLGQVIAAQIGDTKREIVYNGDVLNTSARIQEMCNTFGKELLISNKLLQALCADGQFEEEEMATLKLRGKEAQSSLFSISLPKRPTG